tara:strand:+ start:536 stop:985 length:450 start_codon:yes stop_codon:yes gene_type:complete
METVKTYLIDWAKHFIKNKDILKKEIESIEENKNADLYVKKKDSELFVHILPILKEDFFEKLEKDKFYNIITINNKENFDSLLNAWNTLKHFPFLTIYFINPFSPETKWIIQPNVHERIHDKQAFKTGLKSLFETVNTISIQDFERKIA